MQDAHAVQLAVDGLSDTHFFAVFDGHGGSLVSRHSSAHVLNKILSTDSWKLDAKNPTNIGNAMIKGFLEIDEDLRKVSAQFVLGSCWHNHIFDFCSFLKLSEAMTTAAPQPLQHS
jgi:serine/threonine protein phosphatase PrpC